MPVNPTNDSISISVEMKYIKREGGGGQPEGIQYPDKPEGIQYPGKPEGIQYAGKPEGIWYPAPDEVREKVQRLLQVVQDKKTQSKEVVFISIELNLQSIDANIQNVEDPKVIASSVQRFVKELTEREKYIHNCMTEAKYCCCGWIEISKAQFLKKELEEFDERLKSFNRILEKGIQYEVRREVQRLLQVVQKKKTQFNKAVFDRIELNLQSIDVNIQKVRDPKAIATSAETLMEELREREKHVHNCMSKAKYCCCGSQFLEEELREFDECLKSFNSVLDTLEAEARNSTKKTQSGTDDNSKKVPATAIQEQKKELKRSNAMPRSSEKNGSSVNNTENSDYRVQGISPEVKGLNENDQSSNPTHVREVKPQNVAHSGISPNTSGDVQPSNFSQSISSNRPREPNKESNSASVAPLKPSGDRGSSAADLDKNSAEMPKLKEIEPIQLQAKPAPFMILNPESFQPEIKPVHQQMKPTPAPNSKKESLLVQNYPRIEAEPVQQQIKPAPTTNSKKESNQVQSYPQFEAEPVQQQIKPVPAKNLKTDPSEVETEPIQLQNYPEYQGRRFK